MGTECEWGQMASLSLLLIRIKKTHFGTKLRKGSHGCWMAVEKQLSGQGLGERLPVSQLSPIPGLGDTTQSSFLPGLFMNGLVIHTLIYFQGSVFP